MEGGLLRSPAPLLLRSTRVGSGNVQRFTVAFEPLPRSTGAGVDCRTWLSECRICGDEPSTVLAA
jgi:hypothetical protein